MKLARYVSYILASVGVFGLLAGGLVASPVYAGKPCSSPKDCLSKGASNVDTGRGDINSVFKDVTNILLFVIGAIAVIMIVLGGIKYTTSNGNADQIKSAKNTIMYAVIGLVVAVLAYAIVNFVITSLVS